MMRGQPKHLMLVACVLSGALMTPAVTKDKGKSLPLDKLSHAIALRGAPQTTSRKRRSARNRRRASATQSSKPAPVSAQSQGSTQQTPSGSTAQGALSQVAYELPLRKPGAGEQRERGLLTDVACDARGVTFKVTVGDRVLKLWTPDLNRIHFATYTPDVSGEITCGTRRPANPVVVVFRPSKTPGAKSDGMPVSVEFVPKNFK